MIYGLAALGGLLLGVGLSALFFVPKMRRLQAWIEYEKQREDHYWLERDAEMNFRMEFVTPSSGRPDRNHAEGTITRH